MLKIATSVAFSANYQGVILVTDSTQPATPSIDPDALASATPEEQRAVLLRVTSELFKMPDGPALTTEPR